jgi:hypothetical protein
MGILKGNLASIRVGTNAIVECQSWSLELAPEFVDTTSFGDTFREQTPTFITWSGSGSGKYDITDTNGQLALQTALLAGSTVDIRFYVSSALYYHGDAYVGTSIGAAVDGIVEINWTFTAASALTYH